MTPGQEDELSQLLAGIANHEERITVELVGLAATFMEEPAVLVTLERRTVVRGRSSGLQRRRESLDLSELQGSRTPSKLLAVTLREMLHAMRHDEAKRST